MDKNGFLAIVATVVIIFILAIFVKPALTGQQVTIVPNEGENLITAEETQTPMQRSVLEQKEESIAVSRAPTVLITYKSVVPHTPIPIPSSAQRREAGIPAVPLLPEKPPTLQPTKASSIEQETVPREIGRYRINGEGMQIVQRVYPDKEDTRYSFAQVLESRVLQSYTGRYSTITEPIEIDASYFIISYTVDVPEFVRNAKPSADIGDKNSWAFEKMYSPIATRDSNNDEKVRFESYAVDNPRFSITVIDAETGKIVKTITETNLDSRMWAGIFGEQEEAKDDKKYENINWDPRPWRENIFAGEGEYLFDIQTNALNSYQVDILIQTPEPVKRETEPLLLALFIQRELRNLISLFERKDITPAYDYFTAITTAHIADEEMKGVMTQQITDLKITKAIVSGFTITDAELYGSLPVLRGTLIIDSAVREEEEEDTIIPWSIAFDSIPPSSSMYQGILRWEAGNESYQTAWGYPAEIIQLMLRLESEYAHGYGNEAILYRDRAVLETYSSDLILLSAAKQAIDISSGVVPVYSEPYLIPFDIQKFIALYNADNFRDGAYGEHISDALSKRISDMYTLDEIYQYFVAMRHAGIVLKDFKIYSVDLRNNEASIRGEYIWNHGERERRTPCEIVVVFEWRDLNQYSMWKIDTLPPLRY
ncbi:MAG: hypothetical protein LBV40_04055 [Methanomicrobiales archaeon]|jgi:hypothetical protein|nr:hypothetical protein [Methanomicrobiales archaeon]